jgi:hypothetical protein
MSMSHILTAALFVLIGVVFAGWLRRLPVISMLPQY